MPTRDARAGRAETRTPEPPEPPDRNEREESPPRVRPKRVTRPPNNYAGSKKRKLQDMHWAVKLNVRQTKDPQ
jgi:hypothetical protein